MLENVPWTVKKYVLLFFKRMCCIYLLSPSDLMCHTRLIFFIVFLSVTIHCWKKNINISSYYFIAVYLIKSVKICFYISVLICSVHIFLQMFHVGFILSSLSNIPLCLWLQYLFIFTIFTVCLFIYFLPFILLMFKYSCLHFPTNTFHHPAHPHLPS